MGELLQAWVYYFNYQWVILFLIHHTVDLGGSLAVASRGLFSTGVSTDLSVTYLNSGGKVGDTIKAVVTCDKCE
jgi:hypothetical protein